MLIAAIILIVVMFISGVCAEQFKPGAWNAGGYPNETPNLYWVSVGLICLVGLVGLGLVRLGMAIS